MLVVNAVLVVFVQVLFKHLCVVLLWWCLYFRIECLVYFGFKLRFGMFECFILILHLLICFDLFVFWIRLRDFDVWLMLLSGVGCLLYLFVWFGLTGLFTVSLCLFAGFTWVWCLFVWHYVCSCFWCFVLMYWFLSV